MAAPTRNGKHIFNQHPEGLPVPGTTTLYDSGDTISLETVALDGGVLGRVIVLSIDPYHRGRMEKTSRIPFVLGQPLVGYGVIKVLRSEDPKFQPGDYLYDTGGLIRHEEYTVVPAKDTGRLKFIRPDKNLPLSAYVGAAGMPGLTAWAGWKEYCKAKRGETIFISTAAGTGRGRIMAKYEGLKVIGSAGSDDKVNFVKQLGADVVFNYKTANMRDVLSTAGPIDIYWDNVGGDTLDAALENMRQHGRVVICGSITGYNGTPAPVKNLIHTVYKQITIYGLSVFALGPTHQASFDEEVIPKLANGTWRYVEDKKFGLDKAPQAILDVLTGVNTGKSVVVVSED